jgi:DNA-binding CsgD family transcriptional regulator
MKAPPPKIGTPREREILECAAQGLTDKEIAARLGISRETVATYWKRIRLRLDGASRTEAVARALTIEKEREVETLVNQNLVLEEEVSARREAERQLQIVLKRLRSLVYCVSNGILLEDHQRKVIQANPAFCTLLGVPIGPEELIGCDCTEAALDSAHLFVDPEGFVRRVEQIVRLRRAVMGDLLRLKDGRTLHRDYVPIEIEGAQMGHLWQFREVSLPELDGMDLESPVKFAMSCAEACSDLALAEKFDSSLALDSALRKVGEASGADRAYIFTINDAEDTISNTHEWVGPGISREIGVLQNLPQRSFQTTVKQLKAGAPVLINRMKDLGPEFDGERESWQAQGIQSLLITPIAFQGVVIGFIGLDSVRRERAWSEAFLTSLSAVGRTAGRLMVQTS